MQCPTSSAIAEIACVMIRSLIAADQLTLTVMLNMSYVNYISTNRVVNKWNSAPMFTVSVNTLNCFKSRLHK